MQFYGDFSNRQEDVHPYTLYKFLEFLDLWKEQIFALSTKARRKESKEILAKLDRKTADHLFGFAFDRIYTVAKYELYRQMSLKLSRDDSLYDPKRLGYTLLVVYYKNRFSNNLVRDRALEILFEAQRESSESLWPTGQLLALNNNSTMAVQSVELARDMVFHEHLRPVLTRYLKELRSIYNFHARTMQTRDVEVGWYAPDQRDKTPTSFVTALALSFIKGFCSLVATHLSQTALRSFPVHPPGSLPSWDSILDSSGAKAKLETLSLGGPYQSAILHGPPGTGKTTLARGLANFLKLQYIELTPADFFGGGEGTIMKRINDVFEHMYHLENTLVFIDEIDDLVRSRGSGSDTSPPQAFDPRDLYVTTLLPRFQELRSKATVVLVLGTNHLRKVDPAIKRLGRIDLIIPVGPLSMASRLHLRKSRLPNEGSKKDLKAYLHATKWLTYEQLKVRLRDEDIIEDIESSDMREFCEETAKGGPECRPEAVRGDFDDVVLSSHDSMIEEVVDVWLGGHVPTSWFKNGYFAAMSSLLSLQRIQDSDDEDRIKKALLKARRMKQP